MNKLVSGLSNTSVKIIGYFLLIFSILSIIHGFLGLKVSFKQGRFGWELDKKGSMVITKFTKGYPAETSGLKVGDKIIKVNNLLLKKNDPASISLWGEAIAGTQVIVTVKRGNEELDFKLTRKLLPLIRRVIVILNKIIIPLLMMIYLLVGLWGINKKPSFISNLIAMVCFSFGMLIISINFAPSISFISKNLYYHQIRGMISLISIYMTPAIWLYFFVNFPKKTNYYIKNKLKTIALIFFIPVTGVFFSIKYPEKLDNNNYLLLFIALYMFSFITLGIIILSKGAKAEKNILKKRQYKLILFGLKYGALSIFSGFIIIILYIILIKNVGENAQLALISLFLISQIIGLILPFTFLNTFFQKKILETQSALKRKLRYIGATTLLFIIYLIVMFLVGNWIISTFELQDPSVIVFLILLLSLTFSPLNSFILSKLEQKLYPEKTKYKRSLTDMVRKLSTFIEEAQILENISEWISKTMNINPVLALALNTADTGKTPIKFNSNKSVLLKTKNGTNFFWDEIVDETEKYVDEDEKIWAIENKISISIPMISRGEQIGLLNIGKKKNSEDYNGDDLEIFQEVAYQTAIALQNIKHQAEHLEKKRMDKELEVARNIQTLLLPGTIQDIAGLQIHGAYEPCFEVGGDYFDIIPIDTDRTALVIADVSGKGAGAALLMSNLQASLRMAVSVSLPLPETMFRINNMIHENSLPSQFITFFIGIWDNQNKTINYINSGHNPPIILKSDGSMKELLPTGIGLGIRKNKKFVEKKISIDNQDMINIYTDGIEDFFNYKTEPFGLDRMIAVFKKYRKHHPKEIIEKLFTELENFADGQKPVYNDDLTIIIAKRL